MRFWLILMSLGLPLGAIALEPLVEETTFEAIEQPWSIQSLVEWPNYSFYLGAPAVKGVAYQPNVNLRIGVRMVWKNIGATLVLPLPLPEAERTRRGDSTQTSIVLNKYWRQHAADLYYQKFRGFYVASPWSELGNRPDRYPQLPDALVRNAGLNWYYALKPESYSLKAAFSQTEFQTKSGGSPLYTYFYNHLQVNLGSKFIVGSDPNGLQEIPNLSSGSFDTLGAGMGYGYTFIRGRFFATAQFALSPALQFQHIDKSDGPDTKHLSLAAKGNLNLATGWNFKEYVAGVKVLIDSQYSKVGQTQMWSTLPVGQFFAGGRF
ncbi:MAG: DUF4421 family protein [Bdellovibrionales bacterium]